MPPQMNVMWEFKNFENHLGGEKACHDDKG